MLKYLVIPLTDDAVSFCHYKRKKTGGNLIPLDTLRESILWSMKENLIIQFLYPDHEVPPVYKEVIDTIDNIKIVGSSCEDIEVLQSADIIVLDTWAASTQFELEHSRHYVIRTTKDELFNNMPALKNILKKTDRLVVALTDIDKFQDSDFDKYRTFLESLIPVVKEEYLKGHYLHFNLLTDRMLLDRMNNCNAGCENLTLAPDGKFYICPAFYLEGSKSVGNLKDGLDIKNPQLYRLDHSPICRICDAFQCHRCVWVNVNTTLEVNTPSHEQCVIAHIGRTASRKFMNELRELGVSVTDKDIDEIDYLDPFDKLMKK